MLRQEPKIFDSDFRINLEEVIESNGFEVEFETTSKYICQERLCISLRKSNDLEIAAGGI